MGLVSSFGASLEQPDEVGCYGDAIVGSVTLFIDRYIVDYCIRANIICLVHFNDFLFVMMAVNAPHSSNCQPVSYNLFFTFFESV
jgi:hypothetical protein